MITRKRSEYLNCVWYYAHILNYYMQTQYELSPSTGYYKLIVLYPGNFCVSRNDTVVICSHFTRHAFDFEFAFSSPFETVFRNHMNDVNLTNDESLEMAIISHNIEPINKFPQFINKTL